MAVENWNPPVIIQKAEKFIFNRCLKKRRLFSFLRENRQKIFDDQFQEELKEMYRNTGAGREPLYPAMMAMALILQGYLGVSDGDAVELSIVDARWQMVLGRFGETTPAFSQGALFDFRERLIASDMDRRLLERTAKLARSSKGFDAKKIPKTLRIAVDSSPLSGAGRVEDTINLIAHAARQIVTTVSQMTEMEFEEACIKTGVPILLESSVKKALDRDWSDKKQKAEAVDIVARQVLSLERWIEKNLAEEAKCPPLDGQLLTLRQIMDQDLEPDPDGSGMRVIDGVAPDRRISIEDSEMRHGRKSSSKRIDGYKRHIAIDLASKAIMACAITAANRPEQEGLDALKSDIDAQDIHFSEAHFDRAYMGSPAVHEIADDGGEVICKPWKTRNGELFTKENFEIDLRSKTITCPAGYTEAIELGKSVEFDSNCCDNCLMRPQCTTAKKGNGRSISIAEDESFQKKMRQANKTKAGRQRFRERVPVEHSLAHLSQRQGNKARYRGVRKNLYDTRRAAAIQNLETVQRKAA